MGQKNRTFFDFQEDWVKLVDKGFADYESLTKDEKIWFNVQSVIDDVENGGLISHYYNSGADRNLETIGYLKNLGQMEIASLFERINELFPDGRPSTDIKERNDIISSWLDGQYDALLAQLDNDFFKRQDELEQKLIDHIVKIGLSK